jgi:hypothetical protein
MKTKFHKVTKEKRREENQSQAGMSRRRHIVIVQLSKASNF